MGAARPGAPLFTDHAGHYDALLVLSFGGPEGMADVIPFLENVTRGRNIPSERLAEVAEHYYHFGGVSPINAQNRQLLAALEREFSEAGVDLPIYWGNRNWHPLLPDTLRQMQSTGIRRALGFVVSGYSSYSGCRQYRENVIAAQAVVGENVPQVDKLRVFYNHPDFIAANAEHLRAALAELSPGDSEAHVAFTAHSIPSSLARSCPYEQQLMEACRLTAEAAGVSEDCWELVYQSRSGRPEDPWLEPDMLDHVRDLHRRDIRHVVILPIGFLSDHMEVLFDLDEEAAQLCGELGLRMVRATTVGVHPRFVTMIRKLIQERLDPSVAREAIGQYPANWDVCPEDCCPAPRRPARPGTEKGPRESSEAAPRPT
ncbi:MAG: ferrochelatase [Planctomycetaceae bacterium]|nr:ferrochelatase [Planctomycetaceae bacterium]